MNLVIWAANLLLTLWVLLPASLMQTAFHTATPTWCKDWGAQKHCCVCVMDTKWHDEYPGYSRARVFVCAFVQLHAGLVSTTGVRIVVHICCLRIFIWTVNAMFCILLTSSSEGWRSEAETESRIENRQRQRGRRKLFTFADGGPLRTSCVSARFSHHYQREIKGQKGTERGGRRQRVVRMTKVRHFWKPFGSSTDWQSATLKPPNRDS